MRKRSVKNKKNYDENIISALKVLPVPMKLLIIMKSILKKIREMNQFLSILENKNID